MSYNENSFTLYRNTTLTNTVSRFNIKTISTIIITIFGGHIK